VLVGVNGIVLTKYRVIPFIEGERHSVVRCHAFLFIMERVSIVMSL
jgi:hypothetical protein